MKPEIFHITGRPAHRASAAPRRPALGLCRHGVGNQEPGPELYRYQGSAEGRAQLGLKSTPDRSGTQGLAGIFQGSSRQSGGGGDQRAVADTKMVT